MKSAIFFTLLITLCLNNFGQNVGIGTNNPGAKLDVNGQIKIQGGQPGKNKVLTSDENGLASWQAAIACYDGLEATVIANDYDTTIITSSVNNWKGEKLIIISGHSTLKTFVPAFIPRDNLSSGGFIDIEVWIEYQHPTYGNIKFKSVYKNALDLSGKMTLPLNCMLPSASGVPYIVGARNKSTCTYFDNTSSSWVIVPLPLVLDVEVQGMEL
ncbi:hypothetical protein LK994_13415 [Ferruginibacter lapsinanis]|uniref:hypothetical protein n=1 Tax=Ferruginibacter lapsinanis TaxID=563172 RepID=UPI001E5ABCDD|nr:hypothetical protein [Ferruginibacter lapsinanis]UEG49635.1 hypothetical protein LK994_13415 [Ferruginibacter lapsinanis]